MVKYAYGPICLLNQFCISSSVAVNPSHCLEAFITVCLQNVFAPPPPRFCPPLVKTFPCGPRQLPFCSGLWFDYSRAAGMESYSVFLRPACDFLWAECHRGSSVLYSVCQNFLPFRLNNCMIHHNFFIIHLPVDIDGMASTFWLFVYSRAVNISVEIFICTSPSLYSFGVFVNSTMKIKVFYIYVYIYVSYIYIYMHTRTR